MSSSKRSTAKRPEVVIFGTNKIAACALSFFRADGTAEVTAFTVDAKRMEAKRFCGLPVVPYEKLPVSKHRRIFVAVGYSDINRNRQKVMDRVRSDGYKLASCISPRSTIMPDVSIGENAFIFHGCIIDPYVKIGEGVLIGSGTVIGHHSVVEDYCYLAYQAVVAGSSRIGHHSIVGCHATVGHSTAIGPCNILGDGAVVCASTRAGSVHIPRHTPRAPMSAERLKDLMLEPLDARMAKGGAP